MAFRSLGVFLALVWGSTSMGEGYGRCPLLISRIKEAASLRAKGIWAVESKVDEINKLAKLQEFRQEKPMMTDSQRKRLKMDQELQRTYEEQAEVMEERMSFSDAQKLAGKSVAEIREMPAYKAIQAKEAILIKKQDGLSKALGDLDLKAYELPRPNAEAYRDLARSTSTYQNLLLQYEKLQKRIRLTRDQSRDPSGKLGDAKLDELGQNLRGLQVLERHMRERLRRLEDPSVDPATWVEIRSTRAIH